MSHTEKKLEGFVCVGCDMPCAGEGCEKDVTCDICNLPLKKSGVKRSGI